MKFKRIFPYLLAGMSLSVDSDSTAAQSLSTPENVNKPVASAVKNTETKSVLSLSEFEVYFVDICLDLKAKNLCDAYLDNMLGAQQRLAPYVGKRGYRAAVHKELPGAPVGRHCVYGQCTQLQRALNEMGDTLTIIPQHASRECTAFKSQMRQKYASDKGYHNCIFEGKMYESDSAFNAAKNAYLARHNATKGDTFVQYARNFDRNNFSVESVEPGSMLIVPRTRGSRNRFHMIVYVGRGRIEQGHFVPDANGKPVFTAHNRELIGYLFDTWDTNSVFAANIQQIARTQYARELARVESLPRQKLIEYISSGNNSVTAEQLKRITTNVLQKMARNRYFHVKKPSATHNIVPLMKKNNVASALNIIKHHNNSHTL